MDARNLWRQTWRPLALVAVLTGLAILAAPLAASLWLDASRWDRIAAAPPADAVWVDPDWWQMPYTHWRLRDAIWQEERIAIPATADVITVRTTTDAGRQFWTLGTSAGEQP